MNVKPVASLIVGLFLGSLSTIFILEQNSTSVHKQLSTLSVSLTQEEALKIAKLIPENLSVSAPIIMSSLWEQAAIGYAAKQLHPGLAEKLDEVWDEHSRHHDNEMAEEILADKIDEVMPELIADQQFVNNSDLSKADINTEVTSDDAGEATINDDITKVDHE